MDFSNFKTILRLTKFSGVNAFFVGGAPNPHSVRLDFHPYQMDTLLYACARRVGFLIESSQTCAWQYSEMFSQEAISLKLFLVDLSEILVQRGWLFKDEVLKLITTPIQTEPRILPHALEDLTKGAGELDLDKRRAYLYQQSSFMIDSTEDVELRVSAAQSFALINALASQLPVLQTNTVEEIEYNNGQFVDREMLQDLYHCMNALTMIVSYTADTGVSVHEYNEKVLIKAQHEIDAVHKVVIR